MNLPNRGRMVIMMISLAVALPLAKPIWAKSRTAKLAITTSELSKPIEITDESVLEGIKIWSGPGNVKVENGARIPMIRDGSILWSKGIASAPPEGGEFVQLSFYGELPEKPIIYVLKFRYDPVAKKGYIYLPGEGEKWYDVNTGSILRGVEGNWFRASDAFTDLVESLIAKAKSAEIR